MHTSNQEEIVRAAPSIGDLVRVRTRLHLVEDVTAAQQDGEGTVVRLRCIDDDALQSQDVVVWEAEPDAELMDSDHWVRSIHGFDQPATFAAFLHTQRWQSVQADSQQLRVQAPFRAGIELKWYQLEPLRRALALPRVTLFIADDVGLGKTIEAGLIMRELLCRQRLRRIVVAAPANVCEQWVEEMEDKFGLSFQIYDAEWIEASRRRHGYQVNPWRLHTRFVISHERLRMEAYSQPLEDWLERSGEAGLASMLVLDEAHHAAPSGDSASADTGNLLQTIERLAPRFEHRLFLSATPHNGYGRSFAKLLHLLDEHRFPPNEPVPEEPAAKAEFIKRLRQVFVRRLKVDLRELADSDDPLPEREIVRHDIAAAAASAEMRLPELIRDYNEARRAQAVAAGTKGDVKNLVGLVGKILLKRALSSSFAFLSTLRAHRARLLGQADQAEAWTEQEAGETAQEGKKARAANRKLKDVLPLLPEQLDQLAQMETLAAQAGRQMDPKVQRFVRWLNEELCPGLAEARPGAVWNQRRVIVFSEYVDTIHLIQSQLEPLVFATDQGRSRLALITGEDTALRDRTRIRDLFNADPTHNPVRILLCTDAAREGINLQRHCADVFHFDLPWNPARLEQRNGRIDRFGQPSPVVRCHYFEFAGRPIDEVLRRLIEKTTRIAGQGVDLAPLIARSTAQAMDKAVFRQTVADLARELQEEQLPERERKAVERALKDARSRASELRVTKREMQQLIEASREAIGFAPDALFRTIDAALALLGHPRLQSHQQEAQAYAFPSLDRQGVQGPEWLAAIDALRPKRDPDVPAHDPAWRAQPPRPVVFQADPSKKPGEVVHLHLEHAVVRRLLGRFMAQGFVRDQLHRACILRSTHAVPRVVALARLTLHSPTGARLHDEIVSVTADWLEPEERRGNKSLKPHGRVKEALALLELDVALADPGEFSAATRARLQATVAADLGSLREELERRALLAADEAAVALHRDADHAANSTRAMLHDQMARLRQLIGDAEKQNPRLLDLMDSKVDVRGNVKSWTAQLDRISQGDLDRLPDQVRTAAKVVQRRIQPIGVVYLWPRMG